VLLKKCMRVILSQNLEPGVGSKSLVNGSQGPIVEFKACDSSHLPSKNGTGYSVKGYGPSRLTGPHAEYRHSLIKRFTEANKDLTYRPWPVVKFDNGEERTIFADCAVEPIGTEDIQNTIPHTDPVECGV
jgi:ATP-dependent DNA helicase PIF1